MKFIYSKYPLHESIKSKSGQYNLPELVMRYKSLGVGMRVFKKTWPENCYWEVYHVTKKSDKAAQFYGVKYWDGERASSSIAKIPGRSKRGIWQYDINNTINVNTSEFESFLKSIKEVEEPDAAVPEEE